MNRVKAKKKRPSSQHQQYDRGVMKYARARLLKVIDWRGSGALLLTLLMVGLYVTARVIGTAEEPAQMQFVENDAAPMVDQPDARTNVSFKPVFSGEAYDTAQRLRETGALAMAISLSSFAEFSATGKFHSNLDKTLIDLQERKLVPPRIEIDHGSVSSLSSILKLNYRPSPFSFEILSLPSGIPSGPAILFRFPLPPGEKNTVIYFRSSGEDSYRIPSPFSTTEQIVANGWRIEHWRGETLQIDQATLQGLREQDEWIKSLR